ncbi:SAM-dependent methyltransferase [Usitatibacter palustris]|uniref:Ribosomal RNA small subunit methyltransferase I n=1 Tax=Usitatibacter palustris TaxID=2732487 RepID=A0A6M4H7S5_9PROT|nr:SAM-dependent methyltransferase [Usitatibacter palustris]QJR15215.1 Ribosomal RNA small subunit methyltransferase I [Usitatibacter palustris]
MAGRLYLVPAWLSEDAPVESVLPTTVLERIRTLNDFVVEDAKSARRFLTACGHPGPMRDVAMKELNEHTAARDVPDLLEAVRAGRDVGLLSEAGVPAVADPGSLLVAAAHAEGIAVVPLSGPSSIVLALMASGLEGQRFRFLGYLPADASERTKAILELEKRSARERETQVFIETPYRNDALFASLLESCRPGTRIAIAVDLTGPEESVRMQAVEAWRRKPATIGKRPATFLLLA